MTTVAILGAGSWGTAMSLVLGDAGAQVRLWARRSELAETIRETRQNSAYLPGVRLPDAVHATADVAAALRGAEVLVLAVPSQTLRQNLLDWREWIPPDAPLLSLAKGIELVTCRRMSEVIAEVTGAGPDRVAVLTGPNLAREIAERQPAAAVIASEHEPLAVRLQETVRTSWFRPYTNRDVVGCELAGAVKNVIALAVGMASGMGLGDNAKASLVTRGLAETARLGGALGADPLTFSGLAGLGDLAATCFSPLSRNRSLGERLGSGVPLAEAVASTGQTAEGVKSAESVLQLAQRHSVDMPITEQVVRVVHDGASPVEAVQLLMGRSSKPERYR